MLYEKIEKYKNIGKITKIKNMFIFYCLLFSLCSDWNCWIWRVSFGMTLLPNEGKVFLTDFHEYTFTGHFFRITAHFYRWQIFIRPPHTHHISVTAYNTASNRRNDMHLMRPFRASRSWSFISKAINDSSKPTVLFFV